jgi:predicted nucleic acid-binding protein
VIVLDASALVDVITGNHTRQQVLEQIDDDVVAPAHQPAEVLSAVARMVRAGDVDHDAAGPALDEGLRIVQDLVPPSTAHLRRALDLQDRIRVVDGLYVALAEERGCPLLTTDRRLAAADPPCEVIFVTAEPGG